MLVFFCFFTLPVIIRVKITPNAHADKILGWEDLPLCGKVLCVKVTAPPVEGKANKHLKKFLAKQLSLSTSQVHLCKGDTSRIKTLEIPDNTPLPSSS